MRNSGPAQIIRRIPCSYRFCRLDRQQAKTSAYISKNDDFCLSFADQYPDPAQATEDHRWLITDPKQCQANGQRMPCMNAGFEHLRLNYRINERWVWEAFAWGYSMNRWVLTGSCLQEQVRGGRSWKDQFRLYLAAPICLKTKNRNLLILCSFTE